MIQCYTRLNAWKTWQKFINEQKKEMLNQYKTFTSLLCLQRRSSWQISLHKTKGYVLFALT